MIATGPGLEKAMWLTVEVETLARQFHDCLQLGGSRPQSDDEIARVLTKSKEYAYQPKDRTDK